MNILFLGGAKRVSMAQMFKRAAAARGLHTEIFSYEISKHVAISLVAKVIVGKKWSDPAIYDDLLDIIKRNDIRIIVPFVDGSVAVAAEMAKRYPELVFAPTTTPQQAEEMFDKVRAATLFKDSCLPAPMTFEGDTFDNIPLIAKPRHGSASKGIIRIDSQCELQHIKNLTDEYLIQERIDNRQEYTVDCYVSVKTGKIITIVPRKRIEVSGGEVTHTETVFCPEVFDLAKKTLETLRLRGAVTIQVIHDKDTDRYLLMEINPRLGGGAVCAVYANVDLPALIISDSLGECDDFVCYRPNTEIVRYQQEVAFYN